MSLSAIIIANHPIPDNSLVPLCLEKILGDTLLQWQLRTLPKETERVCILAEDGLEEIARLAAELAEHGETPFSAECIHFGHASPCIDIDRVLQILGPSDRVLLISQGHPFINQPHLLQELASETCALALYEGDGAAPPISGAPISLPMPMLKSAINALPDGPPDPNRVHPGWSELDMIAILAELRYVEHLQTGRIEIRDREGLAEVQDIARKRINGHWLKMGVSFIDPASAFVGPRVELSSKGVSIEPMARLEGKVVVGEGSTIGQGSIIIDSVIGPNVEIRPYSVISNSTIGEGAKIGPFAHLRDGSVIGPQAHVGNFVETKKMHLGRASKANHLSYLGDCEVGEEANVGAGCITCNYDGYAKHRTVIGKHAFIGSGSQLVAPVEVGEGAILGAGTTLTTGAPSGALVLTRPETIVKEGGADRLREKIKRASGAK